MMQNETILDIVRRCKLKDGKELIPGVAYLFNRKFLTPIDDRFGYEQCEIIVLVKNGIKVGGIYRMGSWDMHVVLKEKYRGQHILSSFFKTGIINKIWPENKAVDLCDVISQDVFEKKKHLVELCNMTVRNEAKILETVEKFGWPADTYLKEDFHGGQFVCKKEEEGIPPWETFRYLGGYLERCPN